MKLTLLSIFWSRAKNYINDCQLFQNLDGLNQVLLLKFDELKKQWDSKDIVDSVIVALTATEKADIKKEIDNGT